MRAANFEAHPTVYFARSDYQGFIKIGFSTAIVSRMRNLQLDNAAPLELLGLRDGSREDEVALFERFAMLRVQGEWFEPHESIMSYIEATTEKPVVYLTRILGDKAHLFIATSPRLFGNRDASGPTPTGYMTTAELAHATGRCIETIRDIVATGRIPAIKVSRRCLITVNDAEAVIQHVAAGLPLTTFIASSRKANDAA